MAACSTLRTAEAIRRFSKASRASASLAESPRIDSATRFSLRALVRRFFRPARPSLSPPRLWASDLPMGSGLLHFLVGGMAVEGAGGRELAEPMADHVLRHQPRHELVPVVDAEGEADKLRQDGRPPRPDLDHLVAPRCPPRFRLLQEKAVDERALPNRASH